jgi:Holliday junction resolvase
MLKELRGQYKNSFWIKLHGGMFQKVGLPDIVGCCKGRFVGIEVKVPGREGTLTALQELTLKKIKKAGGYSMMATTTKEVLDLCGSIP